MCQFCTQHGEGKKWYENMKNYSEEVFYQVNSDEGFKSYLGKFKKSLSTSPPRALYWKQRFPRLYDLIAYPLVTSHLKKTHFGQVVPLEDVEKILDNVSSIVRLPCVCRKVTTGEEKRYCLGIGLDLTKFFKDLPDFQDFEIFSKENARKLVRELDEQGLVHSIWTFNTPFIGALCNCDRDCMAYQVQLTMKIAQVMWKAEYFAVINQVQCTGCGKCRQYCYFNALEPEVEKRKYKVNISKCYGCGLCRNLCPQNAIYLVEKN